MGICVRPNHTWRHHVSFLDRKITWRHAKKESSSVIWWLAHQKYRVISVYLQTRANFRAYFLRSLATILLFPSSLHDHHFSSSSKIASYWSTLPLDHETGLHFYYQSRLLTVCPHIPLQHPGMGSQNTSSIPEPIFQPSTAHPLRDPSYNPNWGHYGWKVSVSNMNFRQLTLAVGWFPIEI